VSAALISIIGPPASGKTTTAEWLSQALPARLIREDYAGNPFLEGAYLGRREFALRAQLYFLFSRLSQLDLATWPETGPAASDYGFCQDAIYAASNLSAEDLVVYRRLAEPGAKTVKPPDLLIALDGDEKILLERIARRRRRHELTFTPEFMNGLRQAYREVVAAADCPVLSVDVCAVDLLAADAQAKLIGEVREALE